KPPDTPLARQRVDHARVTLEGAARSTAANQAEISALRDQINALDDQITGVIVDLARVTGPDGHPIAPDAKPTALVGTVNGLYATSGQVWKHESFPGTGFLRAQAYLTDPIPAGAGRSIAVDQDIWIVTTQGDVLRFRRLTTSFTASRVDFVPRWTGPAVKA